MVLFAFVSLGNIAHFMGKAHASQFVVYALGLALGSVLILTSIMMTKVSRSGQPRAFWTLVVAVLAVSLLSGIVQFWAYRLHFDVVPAAVFGFGLPIIGEALLAYAVSVFIDADSLAKVENAKIDAEHKIAAAVAEAIAAADASLIIDQVQDKVETLTLEIADEVIAGMRPIKCLPAPSKPKGFYQKSGVWYFQAPMKDSVRPKPISLGTSDLKEAIETHASL